MCKNTTNIKCSVFYTFIDNMYKKLGYLLFYAFPRSREGIKDRFLLDKNAIDTESIPSPFEVGILPLLLILLDL
jgi:hypothetical protein